MWSTRVRVKFRQESEASVARQDIQACNKSKGPKGMQLKHQGAGGNVVRPVGPIDANVIKSIFIVFLD